MVRKWSGNDVLPAHMIFKNRSCLQNFLSIFFCFVFLQPCGGQFKGNSSHLMQVTSKIFSNHGGQFNKGNSTHLMQITFKIYPLCLEINIKI